MALRTPDDYRKALRDDREVYMWGERVRDVTTHPGLRWAVDTAALDYAMAEDPKLRELALVQDPDTGATMSRYFKIPRSSDDLLKRHELIMSATRLGGSTIPFIKDIGTDLIHALLVVTAHMKDPAYLNRVRAYREYVKSGDLSMAGAWTDVKGDRSLAPSKQANPDAYVRLVERRKDGIVVRGAKAHTTAAPYVDELIVVPTRAMREEDKDYGLAFAVPTATPGVKLIVKGAPEVRARLDAEQNRLEFPLPPPRLHLETLTVFEDVFVPWERVFLCGEYQYAGPLAYACATFHRFTAVSYKPPLGELLAGAAQLIAEANGVHQSSHIREKITQIVVYTETIKALGRAAALDCELVDEIAIPNRVITNMAKYYFASNYHQVVKCVQDVAGGLVVTAPSYRDFENPATRPLLEKYLGGRADVSTENRLRLLQLIRHLTASDEGGVLEVLAVHAEGSIEAQKLTIYAEAPLEQYKSLARTAAGIGISASAPGRAGA
jgi:4-hydroxybutyryl-CoA dehydratase/vinylacetyl-CoA-Delta-isomerase